MSGQAAGAAELESLRRRLEEVERERDALRRRCLELPASPEVSLSTMHLLQILEHAPAAIDVKDAEGRYLFNNATSASILGARPEDIRGKTADAFVGAELAARMRAHERQVLSSGAATQVEETIPYPDGQLRTHLSLEFPLRAEDGTPVAVCSISTDVTAQKRAEQGRREGEARLRATFDNAAVGIVEVDEEDRFVAVNERICRILGYSREELLGQRVEDLTAPEDRERSREANASMHRGEREQLSYEKRYLRRDGSPLWVNVTISAFPDDAGRYRAIGTVEDISARKAAEAERERERELLSRLIERLPVMITIYDPRLRRFRFNAEFRRVLGWSEADVAAADLMTLAYPDASVRAEAREHMASAAAGWREFPVTAKDGSVVPSSWANLRLGDETRVGIGIDLRERKRAEAALQAMNEKLREADRRKDEFLGMLSHELRNPLAPIRNSLYILDHAEPTGQQVRRAKEIASRQVGHLTRLVDDLLDVTRIGQGKIDLRRGELDLAALARRTADDHGALMHERGLELVLDAPRAPVLVSGDETRLAQVLGNLLHNAAKFTPSGGRVTVTIAAEDGAAVMRVRDTGAGVERDLLRSIFEPFTQAKQTLARSEGGLGLGLALVKGLVAMHGGEVAASSDGPGRGAEFVVRLPLADARRTAGPDAEPHPQRAPARRRRVLVVDDNKDAAGTLAELVELFGHEVEVAFDGPSAIAKARALEPDVVLCDLGLPGMSGYEVAQELRAGGPRSVRLVAVSGYAAPEDLARAAQAGFDEHVAKPTDPGRIEQLICG